MLSSSPPESAVPPQRDSGPAAIIKNSAPATDPPAKRKRKSRKGWYALLVFLLLAGAAVFLYAQSKKEKPTSVTVETATRRTIIQLVSATGKIQPETEVKISPEVAGEIIELPVVDGQPVKKGDLLIRIKPDNYQAQVAQQEASISGAKAVSIQNQAQLLKAQEDLKRYTDLYNRKVINDSDMINYRTIADVAAATLKGSLAQVEQAESALSMARDLLNKTSIYSPIDGRISLLSVKLGERVVATGEFQGTEVMRVADLTTMEARVNVNENDVVNVKNGDQANINIDAYPNRVFRGDVYQIANTAVTTGENTTEEVTNFEVRIHIRLDGASLRPGMSTTADIETATVRNAISIPIQAVTVRNLNDKLSPEERDKEKVKVAAAAQAADDNSVELEKNKAATDREKAEALKMQKVVFIKNGDTVHVRAVSTGIADNTYLEITSGVQPGESIVSGPYRAISRLLKDGAKVVLEKAAQ
jgi:HlyD family secretion protein